MILLANGCSWTYGGGLGLDNPEDKDVRDQLTWPKHLSDLMNADLFVNLAEGCGSNQRIYRTTLDWILAQSEETLKNTVAVIQFTEESRYEYYVAGSSDDPYENLEQGWARVKHGVQKPIDDYYKLSQDRLKYHNSEIQNMYMFINWCESLSSLFNHFGIKYYFWGMALLPVYFPSPYRDYVLDKFNWISWKSDLDWELWDYDRVDGPYSHPSITGHKQLALHMHEAMKND